MILSTSNKDPKSFLIQAYEKFTQESATQAVRQGLADAVAFGKAYIANPDLVERFQKNSDLNEANTQTFYTHGPQGYTDYPTIV